MSVIPALDRGLTLVEHLVLNPAPKRYGDLKRLLGGIPDASLNRLLASLVASGYIAKDREQGYIPAPRVAAWFGVVAADRDMADLARIAVGRAAEAARESAAFALLQGEAIRILASENYPNSVTVIGEGQTLHFEADHAGALAVLSLALETNGPDAVAGLLSAETSRIGSLAELEAAFGQYSLESTLSPAGQKAYADESRARHGVSRIALPVRLVYAEPAEPAAPSAGPKTHSAGSRAEWGVKLGALFLCLPTVRLRGKESELLAVLERAAETFADPRRPA
jgi:hypothetical protein